MTENWLKDSIEAGQWVSEEKYEATKYFPGAKKIRLSHNKSKCMSFLSLVLSHSSSGGVCEAVRQIDLFCEQIDSDGCEHRFCGD